MLLLTVLLTGFFWVNKRLPVGLVGFLIFFYGFFTLTYSQEPNWSALQQQTDNLIREKKITAAKKVGLNLIDRLIGEKEYNLAITYAQKLLDKIPLTIKEQAELEVRLGEVYENKNDIRQAIIYYQHSVNSYPRNWQSWLKLGKTYYKVALFPEARKCLQHALRLHKKSAELYYWLGIVYMEDNLYETAVTYFTHATTMNNQSAIYWFALGKCQTRLNNYTEGIKFTEQAVTLAPEKKFFFELSRLYFFQKEYTRAIEVLQQYMNLSPQDNDYELYLRQGILYFKLNEYVPAQEQFTRAIKINPQSGLSYLFRAVICLVLSDQRSAYQDILAARKFSRDTSLEPFIEKVYSQFQVKE